ncbi:MAG: hypothetical protein C3F07_08950 [Anaerolineales bacterium]|nr:MAG: hypothetical protein C3F07_08950 [Anaerolineales bacterium]
MRPYKITSVIAGILSLLAQGLLFLPAIPAPYIQLSELGITIIGATLFVLAILWLILILRAQKIGLRANAHFLFIQTVSVIGIYSLLDTSASYAREGGFLFTGLITALTIYAINVNTISTLRLIQTKKDADKPGEQFTPVPAHDSNVDALKEQIEITTRKLNAEKHRTTQLTYLNELSQQLETELDPPVAAQLAINMLERAINCSFVSLLLHESGTREFVALASSGKMINMLPPNRRLGDHEGLLGRVSRHKKTLIVNDTTLDPDYSPSHDNDNTRSQIMIPILTQGYIKGVIEISSDKPHAFSNVDIAIAEGVAHELTRAWERSNYNQRLTKLIQAGISLTTLLDPQAAVQEIAILARNTFEARFVFITLLDQQGNFSRTASAGDAPRLLAALNENPSEEPLLQAALNASEPFRVRDLRKYTSDRNLDIDHANLRSALAIPIRLHRLSIGTIIAFGKENGVFFTESDESLADLLASQAAASVESSWLYQELRNTLNMTSMLRQLSEDVIMAEELSHAAELIVRAAHKIMNARETGIVLMSADGKIQAEVELDSNGFHNRHQHPMERIMQSIQMGQSIIDQVDQGSQACYPLLTRSNPVGALWMNIPESRGQNYANIQTLANQAAVTLERSMLLSETRRQAEELRAAYEELEATYDETLSALMSALDARDRETEGHSKRVSELACLLARKVGLNGKQLKSLERGALLHDIGKIGISDIILHKPGKLTEDEWKIMRMHPEIGARIVERIPFLQECMTVVRYHHERWDGSGYPLRLKGEEIPVQARIFAVADVFDALTSKRSYRKKSSPEEALRYLQEQAGVLFDPRIVNALSTIPYADYTESSHSS